MKGNLRSHKALLKKKLDALAAIAPELPCVVIVLNLSDFSAEYMCPRGLRQLGTTMEELKALGGGYLHKYFNPEDVDNSTPDLLALIEQNNEDEVVSFFQQVRFASDPGWHWHLSTVKIFMKDPHGRPSHVIVQAHTVNSIEHITMKVTRLLEENTFLRENQAVFSSLTKREKEVLRLLALGKDSKKIAADLYISSKTVKTHRKNLRKKLNIQSAYDITLFAQAFDLI